MVLFCCCIVNVGWLLCECISKEAFDCILSFWILFKTGFTSFIWCSELSSVAPFSTFLIPDGLVTLSIETSKLVFNCEVSDENESLKDIEVGKISFFFGAYFRP